MSVEADVAILYSDVKKAFDGNRVLDGIDLEIARGETLTILGRSGSGKSVMVSMLVGLILPDEGSIWVDGVEVTGNLRETDWDAVRMKIGFLFQGSALYDSMNVAENVAFPLIHRADLTPLQARSLVRERLAQVDLDESVERKYPAELSGGMQRRVALARTLIPEPQILIYDEPTAGLDPITADDIGRLIRSLQRNLGTTSVVVTHDVRLARVVSDRVAVLHRGTIARTGTVMEMMASDHPEVQAFLHEPCIEEEVAV